VKTGNKAQEKTPRIQVDMYFHGNYEKRINMC